MQIDLERHEPATEAVRSQVCIVGAGIAGLTLAHRLSGQGMDVVLLEAGGQAIEAESQSVFEGAQLAGQPGHPHLGTTEGRYRVLGGSSLRWGGQLLPLSREPDPAWPVAAAELEPFHAEAERLLGVDDLPFTAEEFFPAIHKDLPPLLAQLPQVTALISKWTPATQLCPDAGPRSARQGEGPRLSQRPGGGASAGGLALPGHRRAGAYPRRRCGAV